MRKVLFVLICILFSGCEYSCHFESRPNRGYALYTVQCVQHRDTLVVDSAIVLYSDRNKAHGGLHSGGHWSVNDCKFLTLKIIERDSIGDQGYENAEVDSQPR